MNKKIKAVLLVLLMTVCTFSFSSCTAVLYLSIYKLNLGTYKLTTIVDQSGETIAEAKDTGDLVSESLIVQLKMNGTVSLKADEYWSGEPFEKEYEWEFKSWKKLDTLIFTEEEQEMEVTCDGTIIDMEFEGQRVILKKNIAIHIDEITSDIGDYIGIQKKEQSAE